VLLLIYLNTTAVAVVYLVSFSTSLKSDSTREDFMSSPPPYRPPQQVRPPQKQRTGMAVASLILGIVGLPCGGFLGLGALAALILGIVALVKAKNEPALYGGSGMAIGGIVTSVLSLLVIPIIAAIAIPSFLRARVSANESMAIGDIRTVISAQATYASTNGGYYDSLECLAAPTDCLPNYSPQAPVFLGPEFTMTTKGGYDRFLYPGPPAPPDGTISPSSMTSFAYVAVPAEPGVTGVRAFCGDSSGALCAMGDGTMPEITNGYCPETCPPLY
jgi:type II secretory pathway pseudopilin PulG